MALDETAAQREQERRVLAEEAAREEAAARWMHTSGADNDDMSDPDGLTTALEVAGVDVGSDGAALYRPGGFAAIAAAADAHLRDKDLSHVVIKVRTGEDVIPVAFGGEGPVIGGDWPGDDLAEEMLEAAGAYDDRDEEDEDRPLSAVLSDYSGELRLLAEQGEHHPVLLIDLAERLDRLAEYSGELRLLAEQGEHHPARLIDLAERLDRLAFAVGPAPDDGRADDDERADREAFDASEEGDREVAAAPSPDDDWIAGGWGL